LYFKDQKINSSPKKRKKKREKKRKKEKKQETSEHFCTRVGMDGRFTRRRGINLKDEIT